LNNPGFEEPPAALDGGDLRDDVAEDVDASQEDLLVDELVVVVK